jgi:hypothetical protein
VGDGEAAPEAGTPEGVTPEAALEEAGPAGYPALGEDPDAVVDLAAPFRAHATEIDGLDVARALARCKGALAERVDPEDGAAVRRQLEDSARVAYLARRLHLVAVREAERVGVQVAQAMGRWRREAVAFFAAEKRAKRLTKQVTEPMLDDFARASRPAAYERVKGALWDATMVRDDLESLHEKLKMRSYALESMQGGRGRGESARRRADAEAGGQSYE